MNRVLFERQRDLGYLSWTRLGVEAGVTDTVALLRCLDDPRTAAYVDADRKAGLSLGVRITPTFLVNSTMVNGAMPPATLDSLVRTHIERAR
jgi:protein-disulfide isomerase